MLGIGGRVSVHRSANVENVAGSGGQWSEVVRRACEAGNVSKEECVDEEKRTRGEEVTEVKGKETHISVKACGLP